MQIHIILSSSLVHFSPRHPPRPPPSFLPILISPFPVLPPPYSPDFLPLLPFPFSFPSLTASFFPLPILPTSFLFFPSLFPFLSLIPSRYPSRLFSLYPPLFPSLHLPTPCSLSLFSRHPSPPSLPIFLSFLLFPLFIPLVFSPYILPLFSFLHLPPPSSPSPYSPTSFLSILPTSFPSPSLPIFLSFHLLPLHPFTSFHHTFSHPRHAIPAASEDTVKRSHIPVIFTSPAKDLSERHILGYLSGGKVGVIRVL